MLRAKALQPVKDMSIPEVIPRRNIQKVSENTLNEVNYSQPTLEKSVINIKTECLERQKMVGIEGLVGKKQNIVIESYGEDEDYKECLTRLAVLLVKEDFLMKGFIRKLRQHYIDKQKPFSFSISAWNEVEKKKLREIFSEELCGIVDNVDVTSNFDVITGNLVFSPPARIFLTGQYMEIGVYEIAKEMMCEISTRYNINWKIYRNVKVTTKSGFPKNEFDIVIECEGIFYVIEVKSGGNFNSWGSLVDSGKEYNIVPGRLLLVDSWLSDNKAECIEEFCGYYVSNLEHDTLREKILTMITNTL